MGCGRKAATHAASSQPTVGTVSQSNVETSSQPTVGAASQSAQEVLFSADSAYQYIAHQVAFGARVPGTKAHEACAAYLAETLERIGAEVEIQKGTMPNYAGEQQQVVNIVGQLGPKDSSSRVLLCAHWDSRPWADEEDSSVPVLGANDGASGVGVLIEIARQLAQMKLTQGVDIVLFDAEDMGTPDWYEGPQRADTWCLGSQMWSREIVKSQKAKRYQYGILLDMVGTPRAVFPKEYFSTRYAGRYVEKIWQTASRIGYGRYFAQTASNPVTDDHYYVNTIAHIPCVDIIHYDPRSVTGFPPYWHTTHDDMSNVSRETLDAVGKTIMTVVSK